MVNPKFADLPGIAYDEPDVYETPDVPPKEEDNTSDFYEEKDSECIERLHISTKESYNRFKGKYLTGNVDFSDRISRKLRTGFDSWELVGEGEKESPIEKCRRLQCELNELMQEISALNEDASVSKEEKSSFEAVGMVVNSAKKVLDSLRLEQVLGKEAVAANSEAEVKKLFSQIDEYKKNGGSVVLPQKQPTSDLAYTTRIAELENRLHKLERLIGAQPEKLSRVVGTIGSGNLLEAVQQVSTKAALLQPDQLDIIEQRLTSLAAKMDTIGEKSNVSEKDAAAEQKIIELYGIAKRTEPIAQLLPNILHRMQALENLHNYANNFSKIIAELETTQTNLLTGLAGNKDLLENVQEAFATNLENMNKETNRLEARLKAIEQVKK